MKTSRPFMLVLAMAFFVSVFPSFAQTDLTNLITNSSFETGDYTGWNWTGWTGGWQNVNNDGGTTKDGNYIAGHWNNNIADVECSQTITGLADGYYQVTALATVSNNRLTNQRLFANSKSVLYGEAGAAPYSAANLALLGATETFSFGGYPTVSTENGPFKKLTVMSHVTTGSLTIGFRFSGKGTALGYDFSYSTKSDAGFFKFDKFTLREVSNVATLDSLKLSTGTLSTNFAPETYAYNALLPVGTTTVTPSALPSIDGAKVTGLTSVDVSSGKGSSTITVTGLDGTTQKTYVVNYTVLKKSNDATLGLILIDGNILPAFNPADTVYTVTLPVGVTTVNAWAGTNDLQATLTGDGDVTIVNGNGRSTILVTAEDGTKKTYVINYEWAYLTNPSFETGDFTGWSWTGTDGYVWFGVNGDGDETKTGTSIAGVWNQVIGDVELSQTVTGLANGNYRVTADLMGSSNGFSSRLTTQRLFANGKSMLFGESTDSSYTAENLAILGATETYSFGGYKVTQNDAGPFRRLTVVAPVTDGTLKLGIRTNGDGSALGYTFPKLTGDGHGWFKVDNFTLHYDGPLVALKNTEEQVVSFKVSDRNLYVRNASSFVLFDLTGSKVADVRSNVSEQGLPLNPGIYLLKANGKTVKLNVY